MNFMSNPAGFYEEMSSTSRAMSMASSPSSSSSSLHHTLFSHLPESEEAVRETDDSNDHHLLRIGGSSNITTNNNNAATMEKEHMFDKVVTPSDVGKLNRLVIPKQHAEKYFPLDSSTNEKGLLLNFEDRNGKPWRFRYSYWNSSQSYVMTKGWSRFVKEKKLDAGDIVSFQRGVGELGKDRLFIDWRRRPDAPDHYGGPHPPMIPMLSSIPHHHYSSSSFQRSMIQPNWNPIYNLQQQQRDYTQFLHNHHHHQQQQQQQQQQSQFHHLMTTTTNPYGSSTGGGSPNYSYTTVVNGNPCPPGSIVYLRSTTGGGGGGFYSGGPQVVHNSSSNNNTSVGGINEQMVFDSVPVVQGKAAAKRLRLFGVNMDCPISDESDECDNILMSSTTTTNTTTTTTTLIPNSSNSSSQIMMMPNSLHQLRPNYNSEEEEKGKGTTSTSMSLDLDI